MDKRLSHLAEEWGVPILQLIKLARGEHIGNQPTQEQKALLQSKLSGFYDLSDGEIRELEDYINSKDARKVLAETIPILEYCGDKEEQCLTYIAERLFQGMPDYFKEKLKPETVRETVINLGVITIHRSAATDKKKEGPPLELLRIDPGAAKKAIKKYLISCIQGEQIQDMEDFDRVQKILENHYMTLIENAGS